MRNANMASRRKRGGFFYHDVIKTVPFRDSFRTIENGERKHTFGKKTLARVFERLDALLIINDGIAAAVGGNGSETEK